MPLNPDAVLRTTRVVLEAEAAARAGAVAGESAVRRPVTASVDR